MTFAIETELLKAEPKARLSEIGSHTAYRFQTITPSHTFESVIAIWDLDVAVQLTARDSFAMPLAQHLLDEAAKHGLDDGASGSIRVHSSAYPAPWQFDVVVIVLPSIAKRFEHQSHALSSVTFWIIPAFAQEFKDGDGGKTFWHQLGRKDGWRSVVTNWNRKLKVEQKWD